MTKLCHIFTVPQSLMFIRGQTTYMQNHGMDVHVITSPGPELETFGEVEQVKTYAVEMPRKITVLTDLVAIWKIVSLLRMIRPDIVHSHTPKGGLLGMISAWVFRVPVRIYHIRGLPYMTSSGPRRLILMATERLSCALAHKVICVSHQIRDVAIADRVCSPDKIVTYVNGSGNGVDAAGRFNPERITDEQRRHLLSRLGIEPGSLVIGFIGRIFREKGVEELAAAWQGIRTTFPGAHLVVVGEEQAMFPISRETMAELHNDPRVHFTGIVPDTAEFYAVFDVLVLPTYREGLPNVLMEAASMECPVVSTAIPGCRDVVEDGVTGTLVQPRDDIQLQAAIERYLADPELRRQHGSRGRKRMLEDFRPENIWNSIYQEYCDLLETRGLPNRYTPETHMEARADASTAS